MKLEGAPSVENLFPSIQNAPPEIPVKNWEQVSILKQHHNVSKYIAKITAAYWIGYTSSRKHMKTCNMTLLGWRFKEHCFMVTLLRFFSATASLLTNTYECHLLPCSPCCSGHRSWVQARRRTRTSCMDTAQLTDAWLRGPAFATSNRQVSCPGKEIREQKRVEKPPMQGYFPVSVSKVNTLLGGQGGREDNLTWKL